MARLVPTSVRWDHSFIIIIISYDVCCLIKFVDYDVFEWIAYGNPLSNNVAYDLSRLGRLSHCDVCRLLCLSHYYVCRIIGLVIFLGLSHMRFVALWCLSPIMTFVAYRVCRSINISYDAHVTFKKIYTQQNRPRTYSYICMNILELSRSDGGRISPVMKGRNVVFT